MSYTATEIIHIVVTFWRRAKRGK